MRRSAALIETWRAQERKAAFARPVDTTGLGPRSDDDLLLIDDTGRVGGSLLGGTANQADGDVGAGPPRRRDRPYALVEVDIDFDDATAAGLTCGGHVDVLVQRLDDVPGELRRTQAARRRSLEADGLTYVELGRLHGPTGLDLGARTPAETAVSIVAEILAVRSGRAATALRDTEGRIGP